MKRKPNNGAGPEPREAAGAADPGGAGERNAGSTSGQSVPKSKFRQKSQQEQTAAVFRTEIWEAPYISHTHGASGCGKNEADRAGKTTTFFFHF